MTEPRLRDGTDALDLDATGQAELVRRGERKPQELVEAAIARAEARNPRLMKPLGRLLTLDAGERKGREAGAGQLPPVIGAAHARHRAGAE